MTARIIRFPKRRRAAILVINTDDGLMVLAPNDHGWLHTDAADAMADAHWLSENFDLPIRGLAS